MSPSTPPPPPFSHSPEQVADQVPFSSLLFFGFSMSRPPLSPVLPSSFSLSNYAMTALSLAVRASSQTSLKDKSDNRAIYVRGRRIGIRIKVNGKQNPDPNRHQSEKVEGSLRGSFWSIRGSKSGKKWLLGPGSGLNWKVGSGSGTASEWKVGSGSA